MSSATGTGSTATAGSAGGSRAKARHAMAIVLTEALITLRWCDQAPGRIRAAAAALFSSLLGLGATTAGPLSLSLRHRHVRDALARGEATHLARHAAPGGCRRGPGCAGRV